MSKENKTPEEENIIHRVRRMYNFEYSDIEEIIGTPAGTLSNQASSGKITDKVRKPLELYIKTKEQEEVIRSTEYLRTAFNTFLTEKK